jgi:hypothetical protein
MDPDPNCNQCGSTTLLKKAENSEKYNKQITLSSLLSTSGKGTVIHVTANIYFVCNVTFVHSLFAILDANFHCIASPF